MLDRPPATSLRINPNDITKRAGLERRKLREIIEFCYAEHCYRGHILDYFGDRHHARQCGTCGNCAPHTAARNIRIADAFASDAFAMGTPPKTRGRSAPLPLVQPRALDAVETLRVRQILACATRMRGRFGKTMLASTLRGSGAKNVTQAHLNELSTFGLLKDLRQDDILIYIDALVAARCLQVTAGLYPTIAITERGDDVMREKEKIELALP